MKTSRIACLAIGTLMTFGSFARAESPRHIDALAVTAEREARQVLYQTYSLHAYGPAARELKSNAFQMIRLAKHVHDVAHVDHHRIAYSRGHRLGHDVDRQAHLNRDLAELDRLIHETQDLVVRMQARAANRRPVFHQAGPSQVGVSVGQFFSLNINSPGAYHHHDASFRAPRALERIEISLAKLTDTVHHLLQDTDVVCVRQR